MELLLSYGYGDGTVTERLLVTEAQCAQFGYFVTQDATKCVSACPRGTFLREDGLACVATCADRVFQTVYQTESSYDKCVGKDTTCRVLVLVIVDADKGDPKYTHCVTTCPDGLQYLDDGYCVASCPSVYYALGQLTMCIHKENCNAKTLR